MDRDEGGCPHLVWDLRFRVWGAGCGVWGVGCGVWGVGCGVWGVGCEVQNFGTRVGGSDLGRVEGLVGQTWGV